MGSIGTASTEFCFDMYKELRVHHASENIIFGPLTIFSALYVVYMGAKGNTKTQMEKAIHLDKITGFGESMESQCGTSASIQTSLKNILSEITKPSDNYSLSLASRVYVEETYPVLPEYLQCVKELIKGGVESVSFQTASDQARELINSWIESQTNGAIRNIFLPGTINSQSEMVLANAVSFKGMWENAFKDEDTQELPFRVTEQETKPVQMMYQVGSFRVATVAAEKMRIVELPYAGGLLSLFVLLPDSVSDMERLENTISPEKLNEWTSPNVMEKKTVKVYLPRMKVQEKYNLTSVFMSLGMTDVLSSSANLSGISTAQGLKMSEAIHGAFMEVYEAGSEMASSTGTQVDIASGLEEIRVDRPFLFFTKHIPSNIILLFGKCISP
ncbi:ovalbumin-like [Nothoprocta perdicaria]|uniref:Ovalbumin-like n=1 Tax=Nothoprocta perdicaria TaxID=30464 RepID=A0A8C6ZHL4_NOTPE|nr:ovalbumin-like [Nothoprocta perdicaria]